MDNYDAIVIGGSVSGAPTAMLLARKGYRVLLVEKSIFPRDTNSTHFIWPRGMSYLNRWGLADGILESTPYYKDMEIVIEGISLTGSVPLADLKQRFLTLHGNDDGVIQYYCGPRRYFLDEYLLNASKKSGVNVREGVAFERTIIENNKVIGVVAKGPDGLEFQVNAKIVIGADGRFSRFAKDVGAKTKNHRELSTFAYYGYFSGINREELSIHKKGRLGTAIYPTMNKTQMALVYGPTAWWDDFKKDTEKNFLDIFHFCAPDVAKLIENAKRTENFKACGTMPAFQRELFGPGWALVGDAGSFKDQVTAMGITHSFRDAELITSFLDHALSGEIRMEEALSKYQEIRANDYEEYFNLVCTTAEMNSYSKAELKYFYSIKENQHLMNQMISQFGDTLPISSGIEASILSDERYPDFITTFDPDSYSSSFPIRDLKSTVPRRELLATNK
jgi:menaquinone-9 beta-reductase